MRTSEFAGILYSTGAIHVNVDDRGVLTHDAEAPICFDLGVLMLQPALIHAAVRLMKHVSCNDVIGADAVTGVALSGLPYSFEYSQQTDLPHLLPQRQQAVQRKTKTTQSHASVARGDRVLILDDVLSAGENISVAAGLLRKQLLKVTDALVMLDLQQGGRDVLKNRRITLHSVLTVDFLLRTLRVRKCIFPKAEDVLRQHMKIVEDFE